ncbi:MAG: type II toxin-antitoxin system RelE/ParE family toxin [Planctomycetota bacterium]
MNSFIVVILPQASEDITRNADWWAENHSLDQALAWTEVIQEQLQQLGSMPERFGLAPENAKFEIEIRQQPIGIGAKKTYRAVFTIRDRSVFILAVRRAAQDALSADEIQDTLTELKRIGDRP